MACIRNYVMGRFFVGVVGVCLILFLGWFFAGFLAPIFALMLGMLTGCLVIGWIILIVESYND